MTILQLWHEYSREEVHRIFSPNTKFTPQAGTWGLQGMIRVPDRKNDWVFFVTYGQEQGNHIFDESISRDGILSWQSQPSLRFSDKQITDLIKHDDTTDNIYLFLRTKSGAKYGYLGRLRYQTHDKEREKPVYFQWQLLDWPAPESFLEEIGLTNIIQPAVPLNTEVISSPQNELKIIPKPAKNQRTTGLNTTDFRARKSPDYGLIDRENRKLGKAGELLVVKREVEYLKSNSRNDLAEKVVHVSAIQGDGAGYDILSFELDGSPKYIEVKTTKGSINNTFFISPNELEFSKQNSSHYYLYRIFNFSFETNSGMAFVIRGDLAAAVTLLPTQFRASIL